MATYCSLMNLYHINLYNIHENLTKYNFIIILLCFALNMKLLIISNDQLYHLKKKNDVTIF